MPRKSYGNVGDHHWTRTRADANPEDIRYLRERSRAPGVAEGGESRNFYCMECDGVIPFSEPAEGEDSVCPHCGAKVSGKSRRYFNWVEIDQPPQSDLAALAPWLLGLVALLAAVLYLWW